MAILESNITTRLSERPSDSCDERLSKSKRELMSSQMNDALQSMAEAAKARIEESKAKAERYNRYTIDEVSSSIAPTNDFSLGKCINILETMEEVNDEIFMKVERYHL
nr:hypothetical protein CFP56_59000 [Quercus suber]